ncbi:MAG: hypothetical protein NT069_23010 [Planctomycetota bacterium]|nr:hypothetical protein [Planctomycetota bacterium]
MQSLAGSDAASLATQLEALLATTGKLVDESRSIKRDIAMSVFLLLMRVGDVPPEEAKKLVQDKLINLSKNPT